MLQAADGSASPDSLSRRLLSRDRSRQSAASGLSKRFGLPAVSGTTVSLSETPSIPSPCLRPDAESRPPLDRGWVCTAIQDDAGIAVYLHAVFQSETQDRGASVSGTIQGDPVRQGGLFDRVGPLYSPQSRAGEIGKTAGRSSVWQLSRLLGKPEGANGDDGFCVGTFRPESDFGQEGFSSVCDGERPGGIPGGSVRREAPDDSGIGRFCGETAGEIPGGKSPLPDPIGRDRSIRVPEVQNAGRGSSETRSGKEGGGGKASDRICRPGLGWIDAREHGAKVREGTYQS